MYKLTADGKTMVGCNHDSWRTTASIWFANARSENEYGVCFTGSRIVGPKKVAPQSAMNEVGLVFSRLDAYHPLQNQPIGKKQISDEVTYLSDILHKCKTVDEVRDYINMYDYSIYVDQVFIYIDSAGDYLIVEPYQMIKGSDPTYVLANFCPSLTSDQGARKLERYRNGDDYLNSNPLSASIDFCRAVSDTMSVCRSRNGDGTLLTSIWDTQDGILNLYFYHDFYNTLEFNLSEELAKGDRLMSLIEMFPENSEFQRLKNYKTPFNTPALLLAMASTGVFIIMLSLLFIVSYFRKRNSHKSNSIKLLFAGLNVLLFAYLFVLTTNIGIFYFDAPYQHYSSKMISLSSYIPFLLLLIIVPVTYFNFRFIKHNVKSTLIKSSLVVSNAIYFILLIGFVYWGLFDVLK